MHILSTLNCHDIYVDHRNLTNLSCGVRCSLTVVDWVQQATQTLKTPEEPALTLNTMLLLIETRRLKLWPVITRSRGLMSNMSTAVWRADARWSWWTAREEDEANVTYALDQTGFFPLKANGTVIFPPADNDLLYIPHKPAVSLSALVMQGKQMFGEVWDWYLPCSRSRLLYSHFIITAVW